MPFQAPTPVAHVVRSLDDIQVGTLIKLSVGPEGRSLEQNCRVQFRELLENGGLAVEMSATAQGQPVTLVVVFCSTGHPLFLNSAAIRGIYMIDYYGGLVKFLGFADTMTPAHLAPGVYAMNPGTLLVTTNEAYRCKNGKIELVNDFDNISRPNGTFKVGDEVLIPDHSVIGDKVSRVLKFIEFDVFAVKDGDAWSVHRRRAHGIEPLVGERTTIAALGKSTTPLLIFPLTRPRNSLKVGDILETQDHKAKILEINGRVVKMLVLSPNNAPTHAFLPIFCDEIQSEISGDGTEFGDNSVHIGGQIARKTEATYDFPDEFCLEESDLRIGNKIHTSHGTFVLDYGTRLVDTIFEFSNSEGKAIRFEKKNGKYVSRIPGARLEKGVPPELIAGALYTAPWSRSPLVFNGKYFLQVDTSNDRLRGYNQILSGRPLAYRKYEDGHIRLPMASNRKLPTLKHFPGNWAVTISQDPRSAAHARLVYRVLGEAPLDITVWERREEAEVEVQRTTGDFERSYHSDVNFGVPVLKDDMDMTQDPHIPKLFAIAREFRCESCGTACGFYNTSPVLIENSRSVQMCSRCINTNARTCGNCGILCRTNILDTNAHCTVCASYGGITLVHNYSYKPTPRWKGEGPLYFGTEVELEQRNQSIATKHSAARVRAIIGDSWYAKTDGSIRHGLEFVSHPFSLKYLLENTAKYKELFAVLNEIMSAESNCGIHIHTSKKGYAVLLESIPEVSDKTTMTPTRLIQRGLLRAQKFIYGNPSLSIHFAGRVSNYANLNLTKTCTGRGPRAFSNPSSSDGTSGVIRAAMGGRKSNRYEAMNFTDDTVEYRLFRTTTDWNEYLRNVLFVDSVIQYARTHAMPKAGAPSTTLWRKFLDTKDYYAPVRAHYDAWSEKPATAKAAK